MAHPKRRHSRTRRDKRRTHDALKVRPYYIDVESGAATLYHRVCLESGYYRGRKMMESKQERKGRYGDDED
ncbi:MAG: 50S ribosomal protein L32 [Bacteroidia bacterium]|nr:50S ribosomal protein L32 [Bacteroidia bacterium]MDW8334724.1 50S ribosomal protein L32 [Bacteroidia bacterium]